MSTEDIGFMVNKLLRQATSLSQMALVDGRDAVHQKLESIRMDLAALDACMKSDPKYGRSPAK